MKAVIRSAAVVGMVVSLSGCFWPAVGAGPGRTGHNPFEDDVTPETVGDLEVVWTASVDGAARYPVTSRNAVHVTGSDAVYGISPDDGSVLWERTPGEDDMEWPEHLTVSPSSYVGDSLWVSAGVPEAGGTYRREVLDPMTGEVLRTGGGLVESNRGEGFVLVEPGLAFDDEPVMATWVTVRDSADPTLGWSATVNLVDSGAELLSPSMTLGQGYVYQSGPGFSLGDGGPGRPTRSNGVRAFPTTHLDDSCYMPAVCPEWFVPFDDVSTAPVLDADAGIVYVGGDDGTVMAIDGADGSEVWSAALGSAVTAETALADGVLYAVTLSELVALDASSGALLWTAPLSGGVDLQPAVAGGLVFTGSATGDVQAFDPAVCEPGPCQSIWSDATGSHITGAPAVSDGRLYIGTADGRLIAYGLPD